MVDALRSRATHLGIAERLVWRGTLDGALQVAMSEHGLLVHTARYEAYGMVLTEALASGLPVMSTDSGALDGVESCAITRFLLRGKRERGLKFSEAGSPITRSSTEPTMQHPLSAGPPGPSKRARWRRYWLARSVTPRSP